MDKVPEKLRTPSRVFEDFEFVIQHPSGDLYLSDHLPLHRCPHCAVAKPMLLRLHQLETVADSDSIPRQWSFYGCRTCGGVVMAWSLGSQLPVSYMYPNAKQVDESIPHPAATYLQQALGSIHAPAGAVMLTASAIDAMLKAKGYTKGSLNSRIEKAAEDHLITNEMAVWAHEIRLDANDQRHADQAATLPTTEDARRCIEFALALAEFLFVLPTRVRRGRQLAPNPPPSTETQQ